MSLASVATVNVLGMKMALRSRDDCARRVFITFTSAFTLRPCIVLAFWAPFSSLIRCSFGEIEGGCSLSLDRL